LARDAGEELAHAMYSTGSAEQGQQHSQRPYIVGRGSEPVADAGYGLVQEPRGRAEGGAGVRPDGPLMGDADRRRRESGRAHEVERNPRQLDAGCRSFPPGPTDRDGWQRWLAEWP